MLTVGDLLAAIAKETGTKVKEGIVNIGGIIAPPEKKLVTNHGLFINLEANDGAGKTTQANELEKHLISDGYKVTKGHVPNYGTIQAKPVEMYLNGEFGPRDSMSPYFINSLYANDRVRTWHKDLEPYYNQGNFILMDRWTSSSLVYQGAMLKTERDKKRFIDHVLELEFGKLGIKEPDKTIFLNLPYEIAARNRDARKDNAGIKNDIHERDEEFLKRVHDNAQFIANYCNWDIVQCNNGDEMRPVGDIHAEIYDIVLKQINKGSTSDNKPITIRGEYSPSSTFSTEMLVGALFKLGFERVDSILLTDVLREIVLNDGADYFFFEEQENSNTFNNYINSDGSAYSIKEGYNIDTDISKTKGIIRTIRASLKRNVALEDFIVKRVDFGKIVARKAAALGITSLDDIDTPQLCNKEIQILKSVQKEPIFTFKQ